MLSNSSGIIFEIIKRQAQTDRVIIKVKDPITGKLKRGEISKTINRVRASLYIGKYYAVVPINADSPSDLRVDQAATMAIRMKNPESSRDRQIRSNRSWWARHRKTPSRRNESGTEETKETAHCSGPPPTSYPTDS